MAGICGVPVGCGYRRHPGPRGSRTLLVAIRVTGSTSHAPTSGPVTAVARAIALANTHSQVELRHLNLSLEDTMRFQRIAGRLVTGDARLRSVDLIQRFCKGHGRSRS